MSEVEKIQRKAAPILKKAGVSRSSLFGSFVRDESDSESDIDILVEFGGQKSLLDLAALKLELEKALGRKVDIATFRSINPRLKRVIQKEQVPIY